LIQWGLWPATADRFTYVPLIGIFIMVAWGAGEIMGRWKHKEVMLAASGGAVVLYFSAFTWFQLTHWQNSISLFTRALEVTDDNYVAHNNVGVALKEKGRIDSAIHHYGEALRIFPFFSLAHANLGNALRSQGKVNEAIVHYQAALKTRTKGKSPHNLGIALAMKDRSVRRGHFQESIKLYHTIGSHLNLGLALARRTGWTKRSLLF
jgi:tetratricopeptide (TPR) repeat protein